MTHLLRHNSKLFSQAFCHLLQDISQQLMASWHLPCVLQAVHRMQESLLVLCKRQGSLQQEGVILAGLSQPRMSVAT